MAQKTTSSNSSKNERIDALEKMLVICELKGQHMKARLVRNSIKVFEEKYESS